MTPFTNFASAFLCHSSKDKRFVEAVATALVRRGILAWIDKNELTGGDLNAKIKKAVEEQTLLLIFLSDNSIQSDWCEDEIRYALEAKNGIEHLIPVYMGKDLTLVKKHPLLKTRFLHADGDRVKQGGCGYIPEPRELAQKSDEEIAEIVEKVADKAAFDIYEKTTKKSSEVAIFLDYRGTGKRHGKPELPPNFTSINIPVLTFQPDIDEREDNVTFSGEQWSALANTMKHSLSHALGSLRGDFKKIRILGNAQISFFWLIGKCLDRSTHTYLFCRDRFGNILNNKIQTRETPLSNGTARLNESDSQLNTTQEKVALYIGSHDGFIHDAKEFLGKNTPLVWIKSPSRIEESDQALSLAADLVTTIKTLKEKYGTREVSIIWTTSNAAAIIAAANIESHVGVKVRYIERDHNKSCYVYLSMPHSKLTLPTIG